MPQTTNELLNLASNTARAAGKILRDGWGKAHAIEFKGAVNLVTEIDRASEALIVEQLRAATPEYDILAEESGVQTQGSIFRWVIDPVDGTTNYAHHFPYFAVSIGLEENGASILGAVYDPILDQLFTATRGGGAFLNGAPIRCSTTDSISQSIIATGTPYDVWETEHGISETVTLIKHARSVRINGCASLDLAYVACSRLDAYTDTGLSPWDISAARLFVTEAGGTFQLYGDAQKPDSQYCISTNGRIHAELEKLLIP